MLTADHLKDSKQTVVIYEVQSELKLIAQGVPQGLVLDPF